MLIPLKLRHRIAKSRLKQQGTLESIGNFYGVSHQSVKNCTEQYKDQYPIWHKIYGIINKLVN